MLEEFQIVNIILGISRKQHFPLKVEPEIRKCSWKSALGAGMGGGAVGAMYGGIYGAVLGALVGAIGVCLSNILTK